MPRRRLSKSALVKQIGSLFGSRLAAGQTAEAINQPPMHRIEPLEQRLMFTTLTGSGTFDYVDEKGLRTRISYNDITAEFVGLAVSTVSNAVAITDLLPPAPGRATGPNLFKIYVTHAALDSWISIAELNIDGVMIPFAGAAGPFQVANAQGANPSPFALTLPGGTGSAVLGATTLFGKTATTPIVQVPDGSALGIYPGDPAGTTAGLQVLAVDPIALTPNDLGEFFFGGAIFGTVSVPSAPAGTIAKPASQGGNVGIFYAGAILTGDATGAFEGFGSATDQTVNFSIGGDIRDLITNGPIGGDPGSRTVQSPQYLTGFSAVIGGTVGEIMLRQGGFFGTFNVVHDPAVYGLPDSLWSEQQYQFHSEGGTAPGDIFQGGLFLNLSTPDVQDPTGILPPRLPAPFDSATTPQYLSSVITTDPQTGLPVHDTQGNLIYETTVTGVFQGLTDRQNNYAVPLLAGQTLTVQANTTQFLMVEIIDPDGRIVASDMNLLKPLVTVDSAFQYTPDRPGEYTVRLLDFPGVIENADIPYTLTLSGIGDLGFGTLAAPGGAISDGGYDTGFLVNHGSLGALIAGTNLLSTSTGPTFTTTPVGVAPVLAPPRSVYVPNGDLRELMGASIGVFDAAVNGFGFGIVADVPGGFVGLVNATDGAGVLDFESTFSLTVLNQPVTAIGKDIQLINGASTTFLNVATNQAIGVIRAGNMATLTPSFIDVNADNSGLDGKIDLIDCTGNFGTNPSGGPGIETHDGGNVRYIRVGGAIFQDAFFGGGSPTYTTYNPGEAPTITDDSGATAVLTPIGPTVTTVTLDPNNPTNTITTVTGAQLALTTYGIRDKGGVVVIDATVDNPGAIAVNTSTTGTGTTPAVGTTVNGTTNYGLTVTGTGNAGAGSHIEFGRIEIRGEADQIDLATNSSTGLPILDKNGLQILAPTPVTGTNTGTGTTATTNTTNPTLSLTLSGPVNIDVLSVIAVKQNDIITLADVTAITNSTPGGEIVSTLTHSVGTISSAGTIGLAKHSTAEAVNPSELLQFSPMLAAATPRPKFGNLPVLSQTGIIGISSLYPWVNQTTGIVALWNIQTISAGQGVGNILVQGSIGTVSANVSGKSTPGEFAGIDGPIITHNFIALPLVPQGGRILQVNIGQGILPIGTGNVGGPGIYAFAQIGTVTNNNLAQADIRGNVISNTAIDVVQLGNGSIINAGILVIANYQQASPISGLGLVVPGTDSPITNPTFAIGQITISGPAGIIGANVVAASVGPITVSPKGFGILETDVATGGNGVIGNVVAGGYGIRGSNFTGGAGIQSINAIGNGADLSVANFFPDVRQSESSVTFDPFFGIAPSRLTDLNAFLGTSADAPVISGVTDTGVLEDVTAVTSTFINSITAQKVRVSVPIIVQATPTLLNIPQPGVLYATEFSAANNIGSIAIRGTIDGMQITTGRIGSFRQGGSVSRLGIAVAGAIRKMTINGNFGQQVTDPATGLTVGDSYISAGGIDGVIKSLTIKGSLFGNVTGSSRIDHLVVMGNVVGKITAGGQTTTGNTLEYLRVYGGIRDGSITVTGSAGKIITNGSLGNSSGTLTIQGNAELISVGAAHGVGNTLASNLHVFGTLKKLQVFGRIDGAVTVGGDIDSLQIKSDGAAANLLNSPMSIGGRLYKADIVGGNVAANVTANGFINSFTVNKGNVLAGVTVQSQIDTIKKFKIVGGTQYGLFGSLSAAAGFNMNVDISGNFGDGVNAAGIIALSGDRFRIRGTISALAGISVTNELKLLQVDGNISGGAFVSAHPLTKLVVGGANSGTVVTV